ncbi:hypothetical protein EDD36DRAFT_423186 [Exophiala viscosa]|uniref:Uncharacterized protein n=1 Tax=Exophiala viscosa TaxID=2486360 RepID=A0AAN6I8S8_9EURO|nr:hypothetical protein EDD36DRAFT_423186 [Exophiala viscosa]
MSDTENRDAAPEADKENEAPQKEEGGAWYSKPESMGNNVGDKIQGALNPVGQYTGKGLETVGKPLGGVLGPTVGTVMDGGKGWGNQLNVGFGNEGGGPAKQQEEEGRKMKEDVGGKEQTADNPLGL